MYPGFLRPTPAARNCFELGVIQAEGVICDSQLSTFSSWLHENRSGEERIKTLTKVSEEKTPHQGASTRDMRDYPQSSE